MTPRLRRIEFDDPAREVQGRDAIRYAWDLATHEYPDEFWFRVYLRNGDTIMGDYVDHGVDRVCLEDPVSGVRAYIAAKDITHIDVGSYCDV